MIVYGLIVRKNTPLLTKVDIIRWNSMGTRLHQMDTGRSEVEDSGKEKIVQTPRTISSMILEVSQSCLEVWKIFIS